MYSTPPLDDDLEVIGEIECRLWVASSAPDTDFYCRLLDVDRDGAVWNLMSPTLEVIRAKYRNGEEEPEYLVPGPAGRAGVQARAYRQPLPARPPDPCAGDEQLLPAPRSQPQHRPALGGRVEAGPRAADDLS